MGRNLVIVESPAKAKTIGKYLGSDFVVKSSVGHIRDLPTSGGGLATVDPKERAKAAAITRALPAGKKHAHKQAKARAALISRMGIDPSSGWQARYEILPRKQKVVSELKKIAGNVDRIYLATDRDREGEAIAWHLREAIGGKEDRYHRVSFNEITKSAIKEAFENPGALDLDRVNAQQARRFLDRIVGFMVSPLLWAKVARGLSAGRVQSVAVRVIVEREREIRAFQPQEYWEVAANLLAKDVPVKFQVSRDNTRAAAGATQAAAGASQAATGAEGVPFRPETKEQCDKAVAALERAAYTVTKRTDRKTTTKPNAPFITSTLQQGSSSRLGFGVKKTMVLAQRLYEAGHISYMRTDSTNLSKEAVTACRAFVEAQHGKQYLPDEPVVYSSKDGAQEAHEAIRPSDVTAVPGSIEGLERDEERLYQLIWQRFVACQMVPAQFISVAVTVTAGQYEARTNGRVMKFDGFLRVHPPAGKGSEDIILPDMKEGDTLKLVSLEPVQHFTKPRPRYGEASLVKELEKLGIGRPSTYASIISTIQERGYVQLRNRQFHAEKMGDIVTDRLCENFENLMDYNFTAGLESQLDDVANGKVEWKKVLDEFYADFRKTLDKAAAEDGGMRPNNPTETDIECPKCGRTMQIRTGSTGVFLGCSGYALPPKERCKQTINLVPGDEVASADDDEEGESRLLLAKRRCKLCGTSMDSYLIDEKRRLHVCGNNPDCPHFEVEQGSFTIKGYDGPTLECDKCGSNMQILSGRFGKYFGCTSEDCKNTRKLLRNGEPAPPRADPIKMPELACDKSEGDFFVLRDGAAGLFLAASRYPRNRETRAPKIVEILPHKDELDEKFHYLLDAPTEDDQGNHTVVRWSRKTKEQYVMTEVDKKPTGWQAFYHDGKWIVTAPDKSSAPAARSDKPAKKKSAKAKKTKTAASS
jgi:DNA topoisomerase-1